MSGAKIVYIFKPLCHNSLMQSMTGFGNSSGSFQQLELEVIVKSVNGRYLEIRPHIPRKYVSLESEIIKICKNHFVRGTVDVSVHYGHSVPKGEVSFNTEVAKVWLKKAQKAFKELKVDAEFTVQDLLNIPDFVQLSESSSISDKEQTLLLNCVKEALKKCQKEREREGEQLKAVCLGYVNDFIKTHAAIKTEREKYSQEIFARTQEKFTKLLREHGSPVNEERLLQEVAHLVEKSDVEEELIRFLEHVKNVEKLLKSKGSDGKKLDFYAQELLREVNTIGSKSQYATITEKVVALKSKIEQFREQVQNIE